MTTPKFSRGQRIYVAAALASLGGYYSPPHLNLPPHPEGGYPGHMRGRRYTADDERAYQKRIAVRRAKNKAARASRKRNRA